MNTAKKSKKKHKIPIRISRIPAKIFGRFWWFRKLMWIKAGSPMVSYPGFNCGLCGKWVSEPFSVPEYRADKWIDGWGMCKKCAGGG